MSAEHPAASQSLPAPYYKDEWVTLYHGDCRDLALSIAADLVLTDPPYGVEGGQGLNAERGKAKYDAASFTDDRAFVESVVVPMIQLLRSRIPCVVLTPGNRNLDLYPRADSYGTFFQPAAVALQTFGNLDSQPILYYGRNTSANGRIMGIPCSYRLTETPEKVGHPCPKPLKAWRTLLANLSSPGQTVLDPFAGSGTTLRAAKDLGRRSIGIEIEERYCEIAALRMGQEVLDLAV